jgi:hypothetical protein
MRYVIVDLEGASRGHFATYSDLLEVIDETRADDPSLLNDLLVLRYDDGGGRVGDPIQAGQLAPRSFEDVPVLTATSITSDAASSYDRRPEREPRIPQPA